MRPNVAAGNIGLQVARVSAVGHVRVRKFYANLILTHGILLKR